MMPLCACSITDCPRLRHGRKRWCKLHYSRWHRHGDPLKLTGWPRRPTTERFWSKVEFTETCWLWTGGISHHSKTGCGGYGCFDKTYAHRYSYEFCVGPIPSDLEIDHLCRVHRCVNPDHLEVVTRRENQRRGNTLTAHNLAKTHCAHGHRFDEDNTYIRPDTGNRQCKQCGRERARVGRR